MKDKERCCYRRVICRTPWSFLNQTMSAFRHVQRHVRAIARLIYRSLVIPLFLRTTPYFSIPWLLMGKIWNPRFFLGQLQKLNPFKPLWQRGLTMHNSFLRVNSHKRWNELIPVWDFKLAQKKVLFTWSYISTAFQNDPIFWWTCVGISFRVMFTWYFITRNEIPFLSKWPIWNSYPHWVSNAHAQ